MKRIRFATTLLLLALLVPAAALTAQGGPARPETACGRTRRGALHREHRPVRPRRHASRSGAAGRRCGWPRDALWLTIVEREQRCHPSASSGQAVGTFRSATCQPLLTWNHVKTRNAVNVKLSFPGANPQPVLEPFDRLDTHVSYFIGNDPAKWRADVPVWGGVRYRGPLPRVDLTVGAELPWPGRRQWQWSPAIMAHSKSEVAQNPACGHACASRARTRWRWKTSPCA